MIRHDQIGDDENLAREVILIGASIAPCLRTLPANSEDERNAIAVLKRVYAECQARGPRFVKSQRIGSAAVDYGDVSGAFAGDATRALQALCASSKPGGLPMGSFPEDRPLARMWPERYA